MWIGSNIERFGYSFVVRLILFYIINVKYDKFFFFINEVFFLFFFLNVEFYFIFFY